MNSEEFGVWASQLGTLTPAQVQSVYQRLKQLGKSETAVEEYEPDWLYDGLISAFRENNLISRSSETTLRRGKGYKHYKKHSAMLKDQLIEILGKSDKQTTRQTLAYLAGKALVSYCDKNRLPRIAGVVLKQSHNLVEAIEEQFPGYIAANMFMFVVAQLMPQRSR